MRIFQKFLAIVSIPIVFEIVFVIVLLVLVNQEDAEVMEQIRSQIVRSTVEKVLSSGDECAFLLAEYGTTKDPESLREFDEARNNSFEWIESLESVVEKSDLRQLGLMRELRETWVDFGDVVKKMMISISKPTSRESQIFSFLHVKEKINDANMRVQELYSYRAAKDEEIKQRHRDSRLFLHIWLALGIISNIVFVIYMIVFCRDITNRINALKDNSLRLYEGQELIQSSGGKDEIAEFDSVFYDVATVLQDSFDRERANFDGAADAMCALDPTGQITRANQAFQTVLGYSPDEILQSQFADLLDWEGKERLDRILSEAERGGEQRRELEVKMLTASGKQRDIFWSIAWEAEHKLFMCVGQDVTAYKQLEHAKREFVAMLSHDLRSPLGSIGASFELLENGAYGPINPKMSSLVERSLQSVRRLMSLIGELLDLEKIEAGEMELDLASVPVSSVIDQAVNAVSASAEVNKMVLKPWSGDWTMYADADRIVRVLINLLSNAIKYSPQGGVISVDVELLDDGVKIGVSDQGNGIPEEHLDKIFERYKQVSRYDHSVKRGSGLGLSICKAIVEAHGGAIGVNSVVGQGSTFWFTLPDSQ